MDVTPIGIDDNFFELGGHSLLAIRVIFSVRKQLDLDLDIKEIFDHPTIGKLSAHVACRNQTQSLPAIQPRPEHLPVPLSFSQERLWFIDRLQGSTQYHITHVLNLKGHLNIHALQRSFRSVLVRHEILRSVMVDEEGVGYQVIKDADGWQLDLTSEESIAEPAFLNAYIEAYVNTPFDLSKDYMLRVNLIQRSAVEHILVVVIHHIASDMWSMDIMVRELTESYNSQLENRLPELQEMSIQYADYAVWQRAYFTHEMMSSGIQFWKSRLKDLQPLELPADYQRPQEQGNKGGIVLHMLTKSLRDALLALSQKEGTTLFMVLLSGFKVLLHKYTGQSDIYVGCPVAGRQQPEVENLIGFL